jgi:3-methyladenine DNA glycosylase AlkC
MEQNFQVRNVFNERAVSQLAANLGRAWPEFDVRGFRDAIIPRLEQLSFSQRSNLIRDSLWMYLPQDYPRALAILLAALPPELPHCEVTGLDGFIILPQNDFVAKYGLDHFELSMQALYEMTRRFSAEGAIRAFLLKYPERTLAILSRWAEDENCHVRRLVSEGTRPRLPWAIRLQPFIADPYPVLRLLEKLKNDPVLMVRRSVANNLNDIAKDHPALVVDRLQRWSRSKAEGTQWLIRHAARTLIKQGNPEALKLFGFDPEVRIALSEITLNRQTIMVGDSLHFSFEVTSQSRQAQNLVIDYIIHHVKANGKLQGKVFKLTKKKLNAGESVRIAKKHSFRPISTRRYYPGLHRLEIQINGTVYGRAEFELK